MILATKGPGITPRKMMSAASPDIAARWKKSGEVEVRAGLALSREQKRLRD